MDIIRINTAAAAAAGLIDMFAILCITMAATSSLRITPLYLHYISI